MVAPDGGGNDEFRLEAQAGCNEMYHFTGNHPEGAGMSELGNRMRAATGDRPVWIKGHGTGTIEAGRLEARHMAEIFPESPARRLERGVGAHAGQLRAGGTGRGGGKRAAGSRARNGRDKGAVFQRTGGNRAF